MFDQVLYWFNEISHKGESIDLWGSIPCAPCGSPQHLSTAQPGEAQDQIPQEKRQTIEVLLDNYALLADVAVASGGSASFEWPVRCEGWEDDKLTSLISSLNMYAAYPTGCGMGLEIDGKFPLKEWRVVTTDKRLAVNLDRFGCSHTPGHKHDPVEGDRRSGIYNTKMAVAILSGLNPHVAFHQVPKLPTVHGAIAHEQKGILMAQLVFGMIHTPLSRTELLNHPEGKAKIKEEADAMRALGVWGESVGELFELEDLKRISREKGETVHVAELMPIGSIKNAESAERAKLKVRSVFRGDETRDQNGDLALFRDLKSLPATVSTINLVLYYGLRKRNCVRIADAQRAYLQAPIGSPVPTYVILPKEMWHGHWFGRYRRVAARLYKAIYGHPTSGDDWSCYFDGTLVRKLQGERVEGVPSLWWFPSLELLVAGYVDDVVASGPEVSMGIFWEELGKLITIDGVSEPGRYLGRDHLIYEFPKGKKVFLFMKDYAITAYKLYEDQFNCSLKMYDTPFVTESVLTPEGYNEPGQLAGKAAQLLMKMLWLSRLSRPDIAFAISSLASNISKWTRNHDLMLYRLLGYVKATIDFGVHGTVIANEEVPRLHLFADADLAGDVMTMKSHSGHFIVVMDDEGTFFPLFWSSKRQSCVSRSTTEAEIVSASTLVFEEGLPMNTVPQMILKETVQTVLQEDNQAVLVILRTGYSQKLRALNRTHKISVAALSDAIQARDITPTSTPSEDQLADIFAKAMVRPSFLAMRKRIGVDLPPKVSFKPK